ncbi:ankyrin, partial [Trametes versicolor FP-101664 SS1]|uniref:ankyrin n=1 Tax=Trametes versicolor (strain FP-101664) TaxID=717944 RepID=UPI0004621476
SLNFSSALLRPFARSCYWGDLQAVKEAVESGAAPELTTLETAYKHGYVTLLFFGAREAGLSSTRGDLADHIGTLKYLLERGASPNTPDIVGYTPLHHACMAHPRADIARILLQHGANPDAQDRFGSVALIGAFQNESIAAIEVLLEFGARLDVADPNGHTPDSFFVQCGPKVTAVVQKWKRKRAGTANPLDEKRCATCARADGPLKFCAKCHATWYCSKECQKEDWKNHKPTCQPFCAGSTITLIPCYSDEITSLASWSDMARERLGQPFDKRPARNSRSVHIPRISPGQTKQMIIKVQVPMDVEAGLPSDKHVGNLLVYDKKRSLVCRIRKCDNVEGYMRLSETVLTQGVMGAKAYFSAEMTSPDALVVKVFEVLAEQAF